MAKPSLKNKTWEEMNKVMKAQVLTLGKDADKNFSMSDTKMITKD